MFSSGCEREVYFHLSVWLAYHTSSHLFFGDSIISSATAVQQGDPLGPVLFSLAIHSLASELVSTFNVWYHDDGTLGGSPRSVLADFTTMLEQSSSLGLSLNLSKCQLYVTGASSGHLFDKFQSDAPPSRFFRGNFVGFSYNAGRTTFKF